MNTAHLKVPFIIPTAQSSNVERTNFYPCATDLAGLQAGLARSLG